MKRALLVGYGAIGRIVHDKVAGDPGIRITHILEQPGRREQIAATVGPTVRVICGLAELDERPDCAIECAGHAAVVGAVVPLLQRGVDVALVSVGALAEPGLPEQLEAAVVAGRAQLTLISGAVGGIDAISSAMQGGLEEVVYTGRKPPIGWMGTPAEKLVDLKALTSAVPIFEGTAREAARLYPKNANVAATVSLAGLGLDRTRVTLIADPAVTRNIHRISACGAFGEMEVTMAGNPLADNPKTSSLAAFSAVRALRNFGAAVRF